MTNKYIELKQRRDIGQMVTDYFTFFKQNLKNFLNIFISYNGIFLLGFLGVSYLMVTGFVGMIQASNNPTSFSEIEQTMYWGFGLLGLVLLLVVTSLLNYSLAASYMAEYEQNGLKEKVEKRAVWERITDNLGSIILFVLLAFLMLLGLFIVTVILAFIPLIGMIATYFIQMAFVSWLGVSFMAIFHKKMDVMKGLGEGWNLFIMNIWKCIFTNLVISILIMMLTMVVLTIPAILIGAYVFMSTESGVDLEQSAFAKIVWTLALTIYLFVITFGQSLSQFINGIIYFSLYEETYNEFARSKIEQIGSGE